MICPNCSNEMQSRGIKNGVHTYYCRNCPDGQNWQRVREVDGKILEQENNSQKSSFKQEGENIFISYVSDHVPSMDEVARLYDINMDEWEFAGLETTDWQMGRADKQTDLEFRDGVSNGYVKDSGKINRVWLHRINVKLKRKTQEIRARSFVKELIDEIKANAPIYPVITYPQLNEPVTYEITFPDVHFGRLAWGAETGDDYDINIAERDLNNVFDELLSYTKFFQVSQIVLPFMGDFFNSDNLENSTSHGTPQQEDTRWKKTFSKGCKLARTIIDKCATIAPVDVLVITGNHDEQRSFYMGEVLDAYYTNSKNVTVDNSPRNRKYRLVGKTLLGFAHGYYEKLDKLGSVMADEAPELWAKSQIREMHTGDKHRKFDASEETGVTLRILRALAATDAWTYNKAFKSQRAVESFMWHPNKGLVGQFTAQP